MNSPTPVAPPKPRKTRYPATVKRIERITPRMLKVTFTSPELANFAWNGPAAHIKLIFSDADASAATPPGADAPRSPMRTYTPRRFDRETRELDVDFVIHGEGPASTWAAQAAVGQTLLIAGPGRNYVVDSGADWFLLAGDDTAIPAIATILETLPASARATVFIEVVDAHEEHDFHAGAKADIHWLHRGDNPARAGAPLEKALREFALPTGPGRVYVACESGAMRRIRRYFLAERALDRDHVVTRGYWKLGSVDHPDGDYGQDA